MRPSGAFRRSSEEARPSSASRSALQGRETKIGRPHKITFIMCYELNVRIEPALLPVRPTSFSRKTNTQKEARLDVAAVGLYAPLERTFFDIRVTHPNCNSNTFKPLDKMYSAHLIHDVNPSQLGEAQWCISPI